MGRTASLRASVLRGACLAAARPPSGRPSCPACQDACLLLTCAGDEGWWDKHKIWIGESNPPGVQLSYSQLLASSKFCFSLMGDGFSSRFDDAVIHGWAGVLNRARVAWCNAACLPA